jgi:hypothetical protein
MKEIKDDIDKNDYYIIPGNADEETLYIHKVRSAPTFFRGCFEYCYQERLATIYKDMFNTWSLLVLFTDEIANAFLDWSNVNFELLQSPFHSTEFEWEKREKEWAPKGFRVVVLRGNLDLYCLLRYMRTCIKDDVEGAPGWFDVYTKIESQFSKDFV